MMVDNEKGDCEWDKRQDMVRDEVEENEGSLVNDESQCIDGWDQSEEMADYIMFSEWYLTQTISVL